MPDRRNVTNAQLATLTASKTVTNFGVRWVPFFLPTLAAAFTASTGQMTAVLGIAEMTGLSTLLIAGHLDRMPLIADILPEVRHNTDIEGDFNGG